MEVTMSPYSSLWVKQSFKHDTHQNFAEVDFKFEMENVFPNYIYNESVCDRRKQLYRSV